MIAAALIIVSFLAHTTVQREADLAIDLHVETASARAGEYITTRVSYTNVGTDAFYIQKAKNQGPGALALVATSDDCEFRMGFAHYSMLLEDLRFLYVPLKVGDRSESAGPDIGARDYLAGGGLVLPFPGVYKVRARFESTGDRVEGGIWPIWRGVAESAEVTVTIDEPDERILDEKREFVRACMNDMTACEGRSLELDYFTVVYAPHVAPHLGRLLEASLRDRNLFGIAFFAARALANQGREEDSELLFRLVDEYRGNSGAQDLLNRTVATWERRAGCVITRSER